MNPDGSFGNDECVRNLSIAAIRANSSHGGVPHQARHDLLADQPQRVHDPRARDGVAHVQLQSAQARASRLRRPAGADRPARRSTERPGATWSSASQTASSPHASAASTSSKASVNACDSGYPSGHSNSCDSPNSIETIPRGRVWRPKHDTPPRPLMVQYFSGRRRSWIPRAAGA
jgi:hypothetical protein